MHESLIILDGDQKTTKGKSSSNILTLRGTSSPERELATMINSLPDNDPFWETIPDAYSKQFVFQNYSLDDIRIDREKAKKWFNEQKRVLGAWMCYCYQKMEGQKFCRH